MGLSHREVWSEPSGEVAVLAGLKPEALCAHPHGALRGLETRPGWR